MFVYFSKNLHAFHCCCLFVCLSHMCAVPSSSAPKSMQSKKAADATNTHLHILMQTGVCVCRSVRNVGNVNGIVLLAQRVYVSVCVHVGVGVGVVKG